MFIHYTNSNHWKKFRPIISKNIKGIMKNLITLSMLLFSCTVFAPGNSQQKRTEIENADIVINPHCCQNGYVTCIACTLCCFHCCTPRPTKDATLPNREMEQPTHDKMD